MALTFEEEKMLENLKHEHKVLFENIRHKNKMAELEKELEYAKCVGGDVYEHDPSGTGNCCISYTKKD